MRQPGDAPVPAKRALPRDRAGTRTQLTEAPRFNALSGESSGVIDRFKERRSARMKRFDETRAPVPRHRVFSSERDLSAGCLLVGD